MVSSAGSARTRVPAGADAGVLSAPGRLAALRQVGLGPAADAGMERLARLVASTLQVPVALVSLVEKDRQVFPGMVGLAEPWATTRQTPLSHSLCQHVTASGSPLILSDAREDERTCSNLAIGDLGVIAYAGMPLTDGLCVPLPGTRRTLGTLILGWAAPYEIDVSERAILSTIAVLLAVRVPGVR